MISTIATTFTNTVITEPVAEALSPGRQERFGAEESEFEPWLFTIYLERLLNSCSPVSSSVKRGRLLGQCEGEMSEYIKSDCSSANHSVSARDRAAPVAAGTSQSRAQLWSSEPISGHAGLNCIFL